MYKIVLLGAGNLASQLGRSLQEVGHEILQVYSRSHDSASLLAQTMGVPFTISLAELRDDADIYLFALSDAALPEVLLQMPKLDGLFVHTAGSLALDVFAGYTSRYGVFYPLQTFSKQRKVSFEMLPIFIEANNPEDEMLLADLARSISSKVQSLDSVQRSYLHLAAVFACNFSNHLYALAAKILEGQGLDWKLLLPLIQETASKVEEMSPPEAQTGPALREDSIVMNKHLKMLRDPNVAHIYDLLSQSIIII
ncbi:hypothetical protein AwDysgo_00280 [Bacteroidales bacterium]|nr:hypothetical protein AwDysgo_00280 [Bacteroidales bacterium]